jgi:hypothetical protein
MVYLKGEVMLVRKSKYTEGDIISIKIVNGDELVAKFIKETDSGFVIKNPMTIIPAQSGLALVPSLFTVNGDKEMAIDYQHIMLSGETVEEMKNGYIKRTTGIAPITRGSIIV